MRVVLIWHADVRELDVGVEAQTVPAVREKFNSVELARLYVVLAFGHLVGNEEGQGCAIVVFEATWPLPWESHVFLLQLEVLTVEHFKFIIDDDPKRLRLPIPPVVPVEVGVNRQLDLQNSPRDRLGRNLSLDVGHKAGKLVHFVLHDAGNVTACFIQLTLVDGVHADSELLQPVDNIVFQVAKSCQFGILVGQLAH